jgi:hypothetical protein
MKFCCRAFEHWFGMRNRGFGIFTARDPISGPETWVRVAQVLIGVYESPRAHHDGLDPISAASRCVETAAWRHAPVTAS